MLRRLETAATKGTKPASAGCSPVAREAGRLRGFRSRDFQSPGLWKSPARGWLLPLWALFVGTLACTLAEPSGAPTLNVPATVAGNLAATMDALGTQLSVDLTATANAAKASPTPEPIQTSAAPGATRGQEAILILEPGPGSSVAFPVHVAGEADPTFEQSLVVQITGADGGIITTAPAQINAEIGQRGSFAVDVPFGVPSDQPGRISVYSASARDGGLIHLASVEVTLLASGGAASLTSGQSHDESLTIFSPARLATLSGGMAHVTGFSDYVFENQLGVAICGEGGSGAPDPICGTKGNVLAAGIASVSSPEAGQPGPFTADVPYTVTSQVHGRIVVFDSSPRDGGITHLASQEVTLAP
jgi:immunoglobulin-like protein involved in spore germination